jgi:hypothetical protein
MYHRSEVNTIIVCVQTEPLNLGEESKDVKQSEINTDSISPHLGIYLEGSSY